MAVKPAVSLTGFGLASGLLIGGFIGAILTEISVDKKRPNL